MVSCPLALAQSPVPSRWLFLTSLVAWGTMSSVLWRHVLQHVTHTTVESPSSSSSVCVEGGCYYAHNSGVSVQLFISVCGGGMLLHTQQWSLHPALHQCVWRGMLLHTQQWSLHPALHQCVWREGVTTHTTVESLSSSSSVCVEGGCYFHFLLSC